MIDQFCLILYFPNCWKQIRKNVNVNGCIRCSLVLKLFFWLGNLYWFTLHSFQTHVCSFKYTHLYSSYFMQMANNLILNITRVLKQYQNYIRRWCRQQQIVRIFIFTQQCSITTAYYRKKTTYNVGTKKNNRIIFLVS